MACTHIENYAETPELFPTFELFFVETFTFHSHSATHKNHGVCRINYCFKCGSVFQQFRMALLDLCPLWNVLLCPLRLAGSDKMSHLCPTVWAFFLSWTLWTGGCGERDRVCGEEKREGEVGRKWAVPVGSWGWGQWWISKWIYTQHHTRTLYIIGANFSHSFSIHPLVGSKIQQASDEQFSSYFFLVSSVGLLVYYISWFGLRRKLCLFSFFFFFFF